MRTRLDFFIGLVTGLLFGCLLVVLWGGPSREDRRRMIQDMNTLPRAEWLYIWGDTQANRDLFDRLPEERIRAH